MKRISFLLAALLMMGGMVMAQGPRRGGQDMDPKTRAERMTERMAKEYSLNETQKKELLEVNKAFVQKMGERPGRMKPEMRQGKKGQSQATDSCTCKQDRRKAPRMSKEDREKMRQEMKASRESYEAGLKKIMTKDQYAAYTKKQAEREQRRGGGR